MSYVEKLNRKDADTGVVLRVVQPGPDATPETVAREILSAEWQMERGHATEIHDLDRPWHPLNITAEARSLFWRALDALRGIRNPYKI